MKPLAVDLCCGLGGWTHGLLAEGWDVVGFDIERHVYGDEQYPAQLVLQDIRTFELSSGPALRSQTEQVPRAVCSNEGFGITWPGRKDSDEDQCLQPGTDQ